jgi:hypothetical protein
VWRVEENSEEQIDHRQQCGLQRVNQGLCARKETQAEVWLSKRNSVMRVTTYTFQQLSGSQPSVPGWFVTTSLPTMRTLLENVG